jgi:hypothetical protein
VVRLIKAGEDVHLVRHRGAEAQQQVADLGVVPVVTADDVDHVEQLARQGVAGRLISAESVSLLDAVLEHREDRPGEQFGVA